jgi:hypothetical protein
MGREIWQRKVKPRIEGWKEIEGGAWESLRGAREKTGAQVKVKELRHEGPRGSGKEGKKQVEKGPCSSVVRTQPFHGWDKDSISFRDRVKKEPKTDVWKATLSFGRSEPMAVDGVDGSLDEDERIGDELPRIWRWKKDEVERPRIVESDDVRMVARHCTRRNDGRPAHDLGAIGKTFRNDFVYRVGSEVLLCLFLGLLLGGLGTDAGNRIGMATTRNWGLECMGGPLFEHLDFVDLRSLGNLGAS